MSVNDAATNEARCTTAASPVTSTINESELRQIVDVATSYIETGQFDDADDILQEVVEADAVSPEIDDLLRRIDAARDASQAELSPDHHPATGLRNPLIHLSAPLPGAERLPRPVQRLIAETERDFNDGRTQAALDLSYVVTSQAPKFIPNYLRTAQIRIALGDLTGASELVATVERLYALDGVDDDPILRSIHVALNPDDDQALIEHARYLLNQPVVNVNDLFVPAAINAALDSDPSTARELGRALVERLPQDEAAVRLYIDTVIATASSETILRELHERVPPESSALDLLWWRTAAAMTLQDSDWPRWLERAVEQLQADATRYQALGDAIKRSETFATEPVQTLGGAMLAKAAGQWEIARGELERWKENAAQHAGMLETIIARAAQVEVVERLGLPGLIDALDELLAASLALDAEVPSSDLGRVTFAPRHGEVFERYHEALGAHNAIDHGLQHIGSLIESYPEDLELRRLRADVLIDNGNLNDGIGELRAVARAYKQAGDFAAMAGAMRGISDAAPGNLEIKQKLVDVYLSRGILDEALRELEAIADIKQRTSDAPGAIDAYTRAAEIASAIGNFGRGNDLYRRAVAADPDNVPVRYSAVAFSLQTGAVNQAIEHLREIVRITLAEKDPDEAVAALHQIIGLAPHDFDAYHKLGEVLTAMSEYKQAERVYRRLSDIAPSDPVLQAKQSALAVLAATG